MRLTLVYYIFIAFTLSACAITPKLENLAKERPNLVGFSQNTIVERYGKPDSTHTSYMGANKIDVWTYNHLEYKVLANTVSQIMITFMDGRVSSVSYSDPYRYRR
ncbi:hypothetical protein [Methylomonas sp. LWB]|uniref:hypothetical protein n=1 Tax=Methylomonas sp. LWB TaxID=1905845 RepID=UPI0011152632|nr:hypothetical protein [Methylomonas sp. LWB]